MRKKKDLPLTILQALEPYVSLKGNKFEVVEPKDFLLKVVDKDPDSTFEFIIEQYRKDSGKFQFLMTRSPRSVSDNGKYQGWVEITGLNTQFESWIKLLDQYETVNSFFDDPITKSFKEEFYAEFEIIEEDADVNPIKTNQILLLDEYLESVDKKLLELSTDQNASDLNDIREEITSLRENLTNKSKKWVVSKLSNIWAKIAKQGPKFIKEFLTETKKEAIKQGVKGLINFINENGTELLS